jgi:hypothetical protein
VAESTLAEGDLIFFEQHILLWKERTVSLTGKRSLVQVWHGRRSSEAMTTRRKS